MSALAWVFAVVAAVLVAGIWILCLMYIHEQSSELFRDRRNNRFAHKQFNRIKEFRRDVS